MRIAIVGTGISGLTAAYILNRNNDITVFEKNDYIGGHTHTHTIKDEERSIAVDSGFIVYNEVAYPNFIKLLDQLGVERQKTTMGFSVKSTIKDLEYAGNSIRTLFAQRRNFFRPSFIMMIWDIIRFNKKARSDIDTIDPDMTLGQYLSENRFSRPFIDNYIIPMGAAIWSTGEEAMLEVPALFFIRFFNNHGLLQTKNRSGWWVIKGGSKEYVKKITKGFRSKIRLDAPVSSISRKDGNVLIKSGNENLEEVFDRVVIATHSDQALRMLEDPSQNEIDILGALPYQKNDALLHTDTSILPRRKDVWASWNYNLDQGRGDPLAMTYNMNILQRLNTLKTYCVTLNSKDKVNDKDILKELNYEHPLFTVEGINAQQRKSEISGVNNTYYCGAYWRNGFHEDGVVSALDVCQHFDLSL